MYIVVCVTYILKHFRRRMEENFDGVIVQPTQGTDTTLFDPIGQTLSG
jgi:hypothetical protein